MDNLAALAKTNVPLLHVCDSDDPWFKEHSQVAEMRYRELGGKITVMRLGSRERTLLTAKQEQVLDGFISKSVTLTGSSEKSQ